MAKLTGFLKSFSREEDGASGAEYALLLAIVATGVAVASGTLGEAISAAIHNTGTCITEGLNCNP